MSKRLKRCPFCGAKGVYRAGGDYLLSHGWTAGCEYGHAISPDMETKDEAADWWNARYIGPQYPPKSVKTI